MSKKMRVRLGVLFAGLLVISAASSACAAPKIDRQVCAKYDKFFLRLTHKQRIDEFSVMAIDRQYEAYICGTQYRHPPAIYLAKPFALGGRAAAIFLKGKLEGTTDDLTVRDIVSVYLEMDISGSYDVEGDADLMRLMARKAEGMAQPGWRAIAMDMISDIQRK